MEWLEQAFGPERTQCGQQGLGAARRHKDQDRNTFRALREGKRGAESDRISAGQCGIQQDQVRGHLAEDARSFRNGLRGDHLVSIRSQRRAPRCN